MHETQVLDTSDTQALRCDDFAIAIKKLVHPPPSTPLLTPPPIISTLMPSESLTPRPFNPPARAAAVQDPEFEYDVAFINETMGWAPPGGAAAMI